MLELRDNQLICRFPEVHPDAVCTIEFQRTLRIPDDNRDYPLPPGLGRFELRHVDDYAETVPAGWQRHGGVFLPMYQSEALWLNFSGHYPMAVKVAAGKIDALTGDAWSNAIRAEPQNYLVLPDQPWLDGFCVGKGLIRQFVATPLGEGYTAEEQLTGQAEHGGLQLLIHPMKASVYEQQRRPTVLFDADVMCCEDSASMGLAPGGLMRQEVFEDDYGFDAWDTAVRARCYVHILNSLQYLAVTGEAPPRRPPRAIHYESAGLPWFEYYDADRKALEGGSKLAGLDSLAARSVKLGKGVLPDNDPLTPGQVQPLRPNRNRVREGEF